MPDDEQKKDDTRPRARTDPGGDRRGREAAAPAGEGEDKFRPEAIAAPRRPHRRGDASPTASPARRSRSSSSARRAQEGKKGLEAAASKRLAKIGEGKVKRPSALGDAVAPDADPLLERAVARQHVDQGAPADLRRRSSPWRCSAVGGLRRLDRTGRTSARPRRRPCSRRRSPTSTGTCQRQGRDDDDDTQAPRSSIPTFKTAAERRDAALAKYREVESKFAGTGAAILARLAEGSLLLDAGDAKGATAAYDDVKASALGTGRRRGARARARGARLRRRAPRRRPTRATRTSTSTTRSRAYKKLERRRHERLQGARHVPPGARAAGQGRQGQGHRAAEGRAEARLASPARRHPFAYLEFVVEDRLRELDPTALPPKAPKPMRAAGGGRGRRRRGRAST